MVDTRATQRRSRTGKLFLVRTNSFCPFRQRQRFRNPPGYIQIHVPEPRDFIDVSLICVSCCARKDQR